MISIRNGTLDLNLRIEVDGDSQAHLAAKRLRRQRISARSLTVFQIASGNLVPFGSALRMATPRKRRSRVAANHAEPTRSTATLFRARILQAPSDRIKQTSRNEYPLLRRSCKCRSSEVPNGGPRVTAQVFKSERPGWPTLIIGFRGQCDGMKVSCKSATDLSRKVIGENISNCLLDWGLCPPDGGQGS